LVSLVDETLTFRRVPGAVPFLEVDLSAPPISSIEIGTVLPYVSDVVPSGYLRCEAQEISRSTYSALFAVIGTKFGSGNGSTTFLLPDMRGKYIIGRDESGNVLEWKSIGESMGIETTFLSTIHIPAHTHSVGFTLFNAAAGSNQVAGLAAVPAANTTATTSTGSGNGFTNLPPSLVFQWMIKAQ